MNGKEREITEILERNKKLKHLYVDNPYFRKFVKIIVKNDLSEEEILSMIGDLCIRVEWYYEQFD